MHIAKPFFFMVGAPFVILATPFMKFIASKGYGFFQPEVGIIFLWMLGIALALGGLTILGPKVARPLFLSVLLFLFLYIEILKAEPRFLLAVVDVTGSIWTTFWIGVFCYVAIFAGLYWKVKDEIFALTTVAFVVMIGLVLVSSNPTKPVWETHQGKTVVPDASLPAVVHIVLDGQIGIDGLPSELAEGRRLRQELRDFYGTRGFAVFNRAFTHFPLTQESITGTLNNEVRPVAYKYVKPFRDGISLKRNKWFKFLAGRGYKLEVYQTRFYNYCGTGDSAKSPVTTCSTYNHAELRFFRDLDASSLQKAKLLLKHHIDVDLVPPLKPALLFYQHLQDRGVPLPDLGAFRSVSASPLASYQAMARVAKRMETLKRGEAIFAHILLPHAPFVFDRNCVAKKEARQWIGRSNILWAYGVENTPEERVLRYRAYIAQSRCTHLRLGEILDRIPARADLSDTTIIIHGDHGSKIVLQEPYARFRNVIRDRDIVDSYSAMFAVKKPGLAAGEVLDQRSIQSLFADLVMGNGAIEDHGDIYLQPNQGVVGPNQVRLKMVPIRP